MAAPKKSTAKAEPDDDNGLEAEVDPHDPSIDQSGDPTGEKSVHGTVQPEDVADGNEDAFAEEASEETPNKRVEKAYGNPGVT